MCILISVCALLPIPQSDAINSGFLILHTAVLMKMVQYSVPVFNGLYELQLYDKYKRKK